MLGFEGKKVFVYGLGKSGLAAARALQDDGAHVIAWDEKSEKPENLILTTPEEVYWPDIAAVIKSPGVPLDAPGLAAAQDHDVPIMGDVDLLFLRQQNKGNIFIGITGTNGKSTTTALVGHILAESGIETAIGGNIGTPVMALPSLAKGGVYVLEMSSFQLEIFCEGRFDVGVLLNLSPDHLDRHGDMAHYLSAKMRLFSRQNETCRRVMSMDGRVLQDEVYTLQQENVPVTRFSVAGQAADVWVDVEGILCLRDGEGVVHEVCNLEKMTNLPGRHNWQNVVAAFGALKRLVTPQQFVDALKTYQALPHRLQEVAVFDQIRFINDSKATNADSTIPALHSFPHVFWIVGGKPKAQGIEPCLKHLANVRGAFLIGEAADAFAEQLQGKVPVQKFDNLFDAARAAFIEARKQKMFPAYVLLSPACASYDQFDSFEHRGDVFTRAAKTLVDEQFGIGAA